MEKFTKYLQSTMSELRQVSWPSQRQAFLYTVLVIILATIVALYVGLFDYLFSQAVNFIVNRF
jgi:preprotein translocase subunit SecE